MLRCAVLILVLATISGCTGRFSNPLTCTKYGAPTIWEFPNSQGSYEGIDDKIDNCGNWKG